MQTTGFISSFVLALVMASVGAEGAKEPFFEGLGSYTRKVSTDSPEAQKYFNQGLNFLYGFNHGAGIRSFQAWQQAIEGNLEAIAADNHYRAVFGPLQGGLIIYAAHNQHMLAYAAMMTGQSKLAVEHIRAMVASIPEDFVKEHAAVADGFVGLPYEVLVRFGRWDEILTAPDHPDFLPLTRAMRYAARGIALAAKGDVAAAKVEQEAYLASVPLVPPDEKAGPNTAQAILAVVTPMLAGEILYRDGNVAGGLAKLREGVRAEDALHYSEPPGWILPARHSLGAALMREHRFAEAERVYRIDLARLPENGWALFGLAQSLHRQGKDEEAAATDARFQKIWSKADVQIASSCLCQPGA
jgi:tetratricopeptide (TPR) repeat protein